MAIIKGSDEEKRRKSLDTAGASFEEKRSFVLDVENDPHASSEDKERARRLKDKMPAGWRR